MLLWLLTSFLFGLLLFCAFLCLMLTDHLNINRIILYIFGTRRQSTVDNTLGHVNLSITNVLTTLVKDDCSSNGSGGSIAALNMITNFLFQELKNTTKIRNYITRKMEEEYKEMLSKASVRMFIVKLTTTNFELGSSCPLIKSFKLNKYKIDEVTNKIQEFDILCDLEYKDGLFIQIEFETAKIVSRGRINLKVKHLIGRARIEFKQEPYTQWSFAFIERPVLELGTKVQFGHDRVGKSIALMIERKIIKSIEIKHTLPNYKARTKPFFDRALTAKPNNDSKFDSSLKEIFTQVIKNSSKLIVNLNKCEKLSEALLLGKNFHCDTSKLFLTLSLDEYAVDELMKKNFFKNEFPCFEIELAFDKVDITNDSIMGIKFIETYFISQYDMVVQRVSSTQALSHTHVRPFDILFAVNNQRCGTLKSALKLARATTGTTIKLQFKRPCIRMSQDASDADTLSTQSFLSDFIIPHPNLGTTLRIVDNARQLLSKNFQSIRRIASKTSLNSSDTQSITSKSLLVDNIACTSAPASHLLEFYNDCHCDENNFYLDLVQTCPLEQLFKSNIDMRQTRSDYFKKSKHLTLNSILKYNKIELQETFEFILRENTRFINICLWSENVVSKVNSKKYDLFGYLSVKIEDILYKAFDTEDGKTGVESFYFKSLDTKATVSTKATLNVNTHAGHNSELSNGCLELSFECHLNRVKPTEITPLVTRDIIDQARSTNEASTELHDDITSNHAFVRDDLKIAQACSICNRKLKGECFKCNNCKCKIHLNCYTKAKDQECKVEVSDVNASNVGLNIGNCLSIKTTSSTDNLSMTTSLGSITNVSISQKSSTSSEPSKKERIRNIFGNLKNRASLVVNSSSNNVQSEKVSIKEVIKEEHNKSDSFEHIEIDISKQESICTNLYADLEPRERKIKLKEMICKYRDNIEMMIHIKEDYEKDLIESKDDAKRRQQVLHEIKHIDEKIHSVVLLQTQCQLTLANVEESVSEASRTSNSSEN